MTTLANKVISGLISTGLSKVLLVIVGVTITVVLARKLQPADFGLIGMAGVVTAFLSMLSSLGFDSAIIQKQGLTDAQLSTLFWIKAAVGVLSALCLLAAAPLVSLLYGEPRLTPIVRTLSLLFVISSLYQTHRSIVRKQLRFATIALNTVGSVVGAGCVALLFAFMGGGVWSLVAQSLTLDVISGVLYWHASAWRPCYTFAWRETLPVLRFGLTMAGGNMTLFLQRNIDSLLIGLLLGATALGYYALAYRMMYSPVRQISSVFTDVLFPSLSTLQGDLAAMRRWYFRGLKSIAMLSFPIMTLVAIHSKTLVDVFCSGQWLPAVPVISIVAPAGAIQSVTYLTYVVFPVAGRPGMCVAQYLIGCMTLAAGIVIGSRWGITGAAWGVLASSAMCFIIAQVFLNRLLAIRFGALLGVLGSALAGCAGMIGVACAATAALGDATQSTLYVGGSVVLSVILYAGIIGALEWRELYGLADLARQRVLGRRATRQEVTGSVQGGVAVSGHDAADAESREG